MMDGVDLRKPRRRQFYSNELIITATKAVSICIGKQSEQASWKSRGPLVREGSWGVNRG